MFPLKPARWFYLVGIPLGWAAISLWHFRFPGDEYALWGISSMAGTWVLLLTPNVGDIHQWWIPARVAVTGAIVLSAVGWGLCRLGVRWWVWTAGWLASTAGWLGFMLSQYPSAERALAKNGSWLAYFCSALLLGAYVATILGLGVGGGKWLWRRAQQKAPDAPQAGPAI